MKTKSEQTELDPIDQTKQNTLRNLAKELTANLPLMDGRTKGDQDDIIGQVVTLRDYGFLKSDKGNYVAYIVDEYPGTFFFGGGVLTDKMSEFEERGVHDLVVDQGLPMILTKKKAKDSGRTYTNVLLYPEG